MASRAPELAWCLQPPGHTPVEVLLDHLPGQLKRLCADWELIRTTFNPENDPRMNVQVNGSIRLAKGEETAQDHLAPVTCVTHVVIDVRLQRPTWQRTRQD